MNIRAANENDLDAVVQIHYDAWKSVYRGQIPDEHLDALNVDDFNAKWQSYFKDEVNSILVLEIDKIIQGFICYGPFAQENYEKNRAAEVKYIYFTHNIRGKGYGRELYREAEEMIKTAGYQYIYIVVLSSNIQACDFYEKQGFCLDKIYDNYNKLEGVKLTEKRYVKKL